MPTEKAPAPPPPPKTTIEKEMDVLAQVMTELASIDKEAQSRVVRYALDRLGIYIPRD